MLLEKKRKVEDAWREIEDFFAAEYWRRLVDEYAKRQKFAEPPTFGEWAKIYKEIEAGIKRADGAPRRHPKTSRPVMRGLLYVAPRRGRPKANTETDNLLLRTVAQLRGELGRKGTDAEIVKLILGASSNRGRRMDARNSAVIRNAVQRIRDARRRQRSGDSA